MQFNFHYTKYCHSLLISVIELLKNLTIFFASLFSMSKKHLLIGCQLKETHKFHTCITYYMQLKKMQIQR